MITRRETFALLAGFSATLSSTIALAKQKHQNNGKNLIGANIKKNGKHSLHKAGKIEVAATVANGKVIGLEAKHPSKGMLAVRKVKSTQRLAALDPGVLAGIPTVQLTQVLEIWYYAYWFTDEFGDEWYYWFPIDYILVDGSWEVYTV